MRWVRGGGVVGTELGYAETTANSTTTNATYSNAALTANKIAGLSVPVVGTGRPVQVEFFCASVYNGTANMYNAAVLLINSVLTGGQFASTKSASTTNGVSSYFSRRLVLTSGTSYTFEIGKFVEAGTGNWLAGADIPMFLAVTGR